jgi:hypothetical protein
MERQQMRIGHFLSTKSICTYFDLVLENDDFAELWPEELPTQIQNSVKQNHGIAFCQV